MDNFRVHMKQFGHLVKESIKIIPHTVCQSSYQTILKLSERYYHTRHLLSIVFSESCYQTLYMFFWFHITKYISGSYYKIRQYIFSEFISNNIGTFRVTNKQCCKIILFFLFFISNETDILRKLLSKFPQKKYQRILLLC